MAACPAFDDSSGRDPAAVVSRQFSGTPRVLSVSPRSLAADDSPDDSAEREPIEILHETARDLIEQYQQSAKNLNEIVEQGRECDRSASKSSLQLQERLRLGARMLKAFQSEITRAEERLARMSEVQRSLHNADATIGAAIRDVQSCLMDSLAKFQQQIDVISNKALEDFDSQVAQRSGKVSDAPALRLRCD